MENFKNFKKSKQKIVSDMPSHIFFRSSCNDWTLKNQFYRYDENSYVCRGIHLHPGVNEFKIADETYSNVNLGFAGKPVQYCRKSVLKSKTNENAKFISNCEKIVDAFLTIVNDDEATIFIR